jgi:integrase
LHLLEFSAIHLPKDNKEMRVLSPPEREKLTKYLLQNADKTKVGVLLALHTGLRIGELCALRWEDVDLTAKSLRVRGTMQRVKSFKIDGAKTLVQITSPKNLCSNRLIPLPDFLVNLLKKFVGAPKAFLLTGSAARFIEPRTLQYRFKTLLKKAGLVHVNFHALYGTTLRLGSLNWALK